MCEQIVNIKSIFLYRIAFDSFPQFPQGFPQGANGCVVHRTLLGINALGRSPLRTFQLVPNQYTNGGNRNWSNFCCNDWINSAEYGRDCRTEVWLRSLPPFPCRLIALR